MSRHKVVVSVNNSFQSERGKGLRVLPAGYLDRLPGEEESLVLSV